MSIAIDTYTSVHMCRPRAKANASITYGGSFVKNHRVSTVPISRNKEDKMEAEEKLPEYNIIARRPKANWLLAIGSVTGYPSP
jgi:hypothetical protein